MRQISITTARRLALSCQHLVQPTLRPIKQNILKIVQDLGCIQIDPVNIIAPSQQIVLWSRLGHFSIQHLDELLWNENHLFEDWGHCTSIVPTIDFPIFQSLKREWRIPPKYQEWITQNQRLRRYILAEIKKHGPLRTIHFQDKAKVDWPSSGWTAGRNITQMLRYLWIKGKIMVARREGNTKFWDLTKRVLPNWTPRTRLTSKATRILIAEKALNALGVARPNHLRYYYIRGIPEKAKSLMSKMEAKSLIERVQIYDPRSQKTLRGSWYIHNQRLPLLDRLEKNDWVSRTTLLSPFDNLIYERKRIEQLFQFRYRLEIYVPNSKRQYGPYALPILHGDRFIGRLDAKMSRETKELEINAIHPEPKEPKSPEVVEAVYSTIDELAFFLNAENIKYVGKPPKGWKS